MPAATLLRSSDGGDWKQGDPHSCETGLADFVAQSNLTVSVWLPGNSLPPGQRWINPAISVASWSDPGSDADHRVFWFETELRSIAYGRNRFLAAGKEGTMFVSNVVAPDAPVLAIELDRPTRQLRLNISGPPGRDARLDFSSDMAKWTYVGTYAITDPPLWFELPSGSDGASGFYRAVLEQVQ